MAIPGAIVAGYRRLALIVVAALAASCSLATSLDGLAEHGNSGTGTSDAREDWVLRPDADARERAETEPQAEAGEPCLRASDCVSRVCSAGTVLDEAGDAEDADIA